MADTMSYIAAFAESAGILLPHRFELIDALDDGTAIPPEALSEDHTIGIYGDIAPWKMREHIHDYTEITVTSLRPQSIVAPSPNGARYEAYLEYVPMRGVRFRAEELQYLEDGWWATLPEVKYPAFTTLALAHLVGEAFGNARIYLNSHLPMPLWIRPEPLDAKHVDIQVAVQARAGDRMRPTNIHTECPMEYARRWATAARDYYDIEP